MKCLFFLVYAFLYVEGFSQARIEGYILDLNTKTPLKGTSVDLYILDSIQFIPEDKNAIIPSKARYDTVYMRSRRTVSDSTGFYFFDTIASGIYQLRVFHRIKEVKPKIWEGELEETYAIDLHNTPLLQRSFTLHVTCEFDSTKHLTHCPKCGKNDKVLPIQYGLIASPEDRKPDVYYNGYCVVERCQPAKRCMRCSYEF